VTTVDRNGRIRERKERGKREKLLNLVFIIVKSKWQKERKYDRQSSRDKNVETWRLD
jgi:hypothetical protein